MEEEAVTHTFLLQLYGGLLLIEYVLTHFTHLWGYTFAVLMLLLRMHHGEAVPYTINILLLWIGISYMRTSPTYDGECMVIIEAAYEPIAAAIHYLVAGSLIALKIPDSAYLNSKSQYAFLLLLLIPEHDSLFTCLPMYHIPYLRYYTIPIPPLLFLFRLLTFLLLMNTREYRVASVCLTMKPYVLVGYLLFLIAYHWADVKEAVLAAWYEHEQPRTFLKTWWIKFKAVALRDPREEDDS